MSKSETEVFVFKQFLERRGLGPKAHLVESRNPPEPDILFDGVAYELSEVCAEEIARAEAKAVKSGLAEFTWSADPTAYIIEKKSAKDYVSPHPIELLLYWNGRVVAPDDMIIGTIKEHPLEFRGFRKVWFLGETGYDLVCDFTKE